MIYTLKYIFSERRNPCAVAQGFTIVLGGNDSGRVITQSKISTEDSDLFRTQRLKSIVMQQIICFKNIFSALNRKQNQRVPLIPYI